MNPLQPVSAVAPIGVFDSGVGGLSVLREIRRELPHEDLLYVADSAHVPYGEKPRHFVEQRSLAVTEFLVGQGAKAVVVACNTATGAAISVLRASFSIPIVGIEPAIAPAARQTGSKVIGVLATSGTLNSEKFAQLLARFDSEIEVLVQPCVGLVEQVEAGELASPATRAMLERYLLPLLARGADTIVLGCTHYPFLAPLIRELAGPGISLVDPSMAVARELRRRLASLGRLSGQTRQGGERFWVSGPLARSKPVILELWGRHSEIHSMPD